VPGRAGSVATFAGVSGLAANRTNPLGQPIGADLTAWKPPPRPQAEALRGTWTGLERLDVTRHGASLWRELSADEEGRIWTYLPLGPFDGRDDFAAGLDQLTEMPDSRFYAITDRADGAAAGLLGYMRVDPGSGSIEVGAVILSPRVQRSRVATEAIFLVADHAFALGYRRFEWKCDALNAASCRAARRYGFSYEGTFRQATVYKQRNRDTAWFSILDRDWPALRAGYESWLAPDNFDAQGRQRRPLGDWITPA
jgi:RimJ/RimL family protein N-acetyltransferase